MGIFAGASNAHPDVYINVQASDPVIGTPRRLPGNHLESIVRPTVVQGAYGFRLSPDAPEVLDFDARRSPIFMAAVFDGAAAAEPGQQVDDGTPVHLTIPTDNPWVPLRILGLGKQASAAIEADVFLLTDEKPSLLPFAGGVRCAVP